ncbi:MAG TPA: DUF6092 family protein [Candidatus Methylomirabilis sp.]|nr:DUF6092 family protein [Candidatus Methylomirabilis sp.]
MTTAMVLSEDEALELLAFLVTAARTQLDEAAEYAPLRLLTAAGRLADLVEERVSPETRALLTGPLRQMPDLAVRTADPVGYTAALDSLCRAVAGHLVTHFGLEGGAR